MDKEKEIIHVRFGEELNSLYPILSGLPKGIYFCEFQGVVFEIDTNEDFSLFSAFSNAKQEKECWRAWELEKEEELLNDYIEAEIKKLVYDFSIDKVLEIIFLCGKMSYYNEELKIRPENRENLMTILSEHGYKEATGDNIYYEGYNGYWKPTPPTVPKKIVSHGKTATATYIIENFMQQAAKERIKYSIATLIEDNSSVLDDESNSILKRFKAVLLAIQEAAKEEEKKVKSVMQSEDITIKPKQTINGITTKVGFYDRDGNEYEYTDGTFTPKRNTDFKRF